MPAFNFEKRFAAKVSSGEKSMTIRQLRKKGNPRVGQMAHCFSGMRTRQCVRLGSWAITQVMSVTFQFDCGPPESNVVIIDGQKLTPAEREALAKCDGFKDFAEMASWFKSKNGNIDFMGHLIMWEPACQ
jgi:hypothetical protein